MVELKITNTDNYNKCIDEIMQIINKYDLNFVEAFGVLEGTRNELALLWSCQDE